MATGKAPARDRLLAAANELFYNEGVQTVGIDRVIEAAGVAKASLYNTFGSKDALIEAYLQGRYDRIAARITAAIADLPTPREKLLGIFDVLGERMARGDYRGCAFANASAEAGPDSVEVAVTDRYRTWVRDLLAGLAGEAGATDPVGLARQLHLLYDGASATARMDRDPSAALVARSAAEALLTAAID